ncbi:MAG: peptidase MA family metallohydrolase [Nitrospinaceae bacterium]
MRILLKQVIRIAVLVLVLSLSSAAGAAVDEEKIHRGHELINDWDIEAADSFAQSLIKKYPDSGDAHFLNARVQFMKGNYDFAWKILTMVEGADREVRDFKSLVKETREAASNFISRESEHFVFRFVRGPDEILVHYAEDVLEKSYEVLGDLLQYRPGEKVLVEIYPDRQPFSRISPLTLKDIATSGTVALCKYNRIMMISPGSLVRGYNWMDTLSHEYTHYLLTKKSRNRLPLWMHEGIAKYAESRWRDGKKFMNPIMETILANGLAGDYMISLESMMPSLAKLKTAEDVQLAYAEVSTMMEYMVSVEGEAVFADLLDDFSLGKSVEDIFQQRLGTDLPGFQNKWKAFMKEQELETIPGIRALAKRFKSNRGAEDDRKDYSEVEEKKGQDLTFLGDILKSRNLLKAAIIEYQKAIRETETLSPVLYNKLAGTLLLKKEYDQAETFLKKSLRYYPMFHTTLVNLGELHFETGDRDQARNYFERAVRINPFNPFVHLRLIKIYQQLGMTEEKRLQADLYRYIQ